MCWNFWRLLTSMFHANIFDVRMKPPNAQVHRQFHQAPEQSYHFWNDLRWRSTFENPAFFESLLSIRSELAEEDACDVHPDSLETSRNLCFRSHWRLCQALKDLGVLSPQSQKNSRDWLKTSQTKVGQLQDGATHFWRLCEQRTGKTNDLAVVSSPSHSQDNENGRDFE